MEIFCEEKLSSFSFKKHLYIICGLVLIHNLIVDFKEETTTTFLSREEEKELRKESFYYHYYLPSESNRSNEGHRIVIYRFDFPEI